MEKIIEEFTDLRDKKQFQAAYDLIMNAIKNKDMNHPDLHWRHALICRDLALTTGRNDKSVYEKYVKEGLAASETGLQMNPDHPKCHSWCAVFLNYQSEIEGIKKKIENSYKMRDHWLAALKVEPDDAVTLHALGRWCFEVTDLSWLNRKLAQTFFSTPPTSTYEEGLKYLTDCEKHSPNLLVNNHLFLAKTYQRLKKNDQAKEYCKKVLASTDDDMEAENAKKEATKILKDL